MLFVFAFYGRFVCFWLLWFAYVALYAITRSVLFEKHASELLNGFRCVFFSADQYSNRSGIRFFIVYNGFSALSWTFRLIF